MQASLKSLQDIFEKSCKDVFKTLSRRIIKLYCSCEHVFKMSSRRINNVSEAYCKVCYLTKGFASVTLLRNYGQCAKFARVITVSQTFNFSKFLKLTTPFTAAYRGAFRAWPNKGDLFAKILNGFKL